MRRPWPALGRSATEKKMFVCIVKPAYNGTARDQSFRPLQACSLSMDTWNLYLRECKRFSAKEKSALCLGFISSKFTVCKKTVTKVSDASPLFHIRSEGASGISNRIPQSVKLFKKLTGSELVKELPEFYGSRRMATLLVRATYWARWIHFTVWFYFFIIHLTL
jgi:hypothetical protein